MAMAPPRLLRGLITPLSLSPVDWLPCHQQLLTSAALLHRWRLPSLALLRCPSCFDGFKLLLVLLLVSAALAEVRFVASASMAPTLRSGDRAVAEKVRQGQLIVNGVAQNEHHYTAPHGGSYTMEAMVQRYLYTQTNK